ncbi:MAG: ABC transporter substrate-binding protein [Candidatus Bathyarchaeota archaeon]
MDSKAITKIQTVILVAVILIASTVTLIFYFFSDNSQQAAIIKIGVCTDLDSLVGDDTLRGATLAAEQINAATKVSLAATKLITSDKVDFIIGGFGYEDNLIIQDIVAEHKKIYISVSALGDRLTERVLDNYEKYKYFFKVTPPNQTSLARGVADSIVALRDYTGFNKIAILAQDISLLEESVHNAERLPELHGFEIVYNNKFSPGTVDFSSYFAAAEAVGAEIMLPFIVDQDGILFIKEWYDRQSPMVIWGSPHGSMPNYWEATEGKCVCETNPQPAVMAGYPVTSKTLVTINAYLDRWGEKPGYTGTGAYDLIRFILPDALERAGTLETEAVIKALEEVDLETTTAPRFIFTTSHDIMYGPGYDEQYFFQYQENGTRVPVYPRELKEKAGATYKFPDWSGPWDNIEAN